MSVGHDGWYRNARVHIVTAVERSAAPAEQAIVPARVSLVSGGPLTTAAPALVPGGRYGRVAVCSVSREKALKTLPALDRVGA